jgi:predicted RNA-binding Zn ribbon-like protein
MPHVAKQRASTFSPKRFAFLGGDPFVDFVNTVDDRLDVTPHDRMNDYDDLLAWCDQARLMDTESLAALHDLARRDPPTAARALDRARRLREAVYRILLAAIGDRSPTRKDLGTVTTLARQAGAHARLDHRDGEFEWGLDAASPDLRLPLWVLARSAVSLLTSEPLEHVRQCADETCGWLFLDRSRNHSRRWCDMTVCGNRAKARRNYARHKARRGANA